MASHTFNDQLELLTRRAIKSRDLIQEICSPQHDLSREAGNLYCVLRRLQQEANKDNSPFRRAGDTRRDDLERIAESCTRVLDENDDFLHAYQAFSDHKKTLLESQVEIPFSASERAVLSKFRSDFIYYAFHLSHLTVKASMDSLGEAKDQIDNAGYTLRFAVNTIVARLLAENQISISALAGHPRGEVTLWEELHLALIEEGLSSAFLKEHRKPILLYIKALERRTAFEHTHMPADSGPDGTTKRPDGNNSQGHYRKPPSRKRTRSNEDPSRKTRLDSKTNSFKSSTDDSDTRTFRFSDPMHVFQTFMEGDGAKIADDELLAVDDELLADFLNEAPVHASVPVSLRDQMRKIYRTFCWTYESPCEALLSESAGHDRNDIKQYLGLIYDVEHQILDKLDQLHLGEDQELKDIRKNIINKVQRVLDELEKAKDNLMD